MIATNARTAAITMALQMTQNQWTDRSNAKYAAFGYMDLVAKTGG